MCTLPPQDHLACGLSDCLSSSRSAVEFPVFRNLVYELTAGQVGTGFAWKLYICCAAATPVSGTRVVSGLHPGTPKGVKDFLRQTSNQSWPHLAVNPCQTCSCEPSQRSNHPLQLSPVLCPVLQCPCPALAALQLHWQASLSKCPRSGYT